MSLILCGFHPVVLTAEGLDALDVVRLAATSQRKYMVAIDCGDHLILSPAHATQRLFAKDEKS